MEHKQQIVYRHKISDADQPKRVHANRLLSSAKARHVKPSDRLAAKSLMIVIEVKGEYVELCLH